MRLILAVAAVTFLSSCGTPAPDAPPVGTVPITQVCPRPAQYTQAEKDQAADEIDALPPKAELRVMEADYRRERKELEACVGAKP